MNDARVSFKEIAHRFRNPQWVAYYSWRMLQESSAPLVPTTFNRLFQKVRPLTMVSYARLRGLHNAVKHVISHGVSGDIVECGVARGGSAAMLGLTLQELGTKRDLWLFDTFQGLPRPTQDDADFEIADLYTGKCLGSVEDVRDSLARLAIRDNLHLVPGLFQDTLPSAPVASIAVLHVDGDWYESVKICLESLFDKVAIGGVIQFDDYAHWAGARKAVDEFFASRGIRPTLRKLDFAGRQMVKV
jgi:O-methyltransferase